MPQKRVTVKKSKEIIRLYIHGELSCRRISQALDLSRPVVSRVINRWKETGLSWEELQGVPDSEFQEMLYPQNRPPGKADQLKEQFPRFATELKRPGVTLQLLWEEYIRDNPEGLKYSRFCHHFQQWKADSQISLHLEHKAGDKMFVDYAGKKREIINPQTGEKSWKELFVAILPASQLIYAEFTNDQTKESFIRSLERALRFFGGVPAAIVPDNLKSAVVKPNFYEPEINPLLDDFAQYYRTAILPARARKPKDKAHVENAVKIAYRRIMAPLRDKTFITLEDLNEALDEKLEELNNRNLTKMTVSRRELFDQVERRELRSLPTGQYPLKFFQDNTLVAFNYHIYLKEDKHYYSVPYLLKGKRVRVVYDERIVSLYHDNSRICQYQRDRRANGYTTKKEHMPDKHRYFQDWSPKKFRWWAGNVGDDTLRVINYLMESKDHPEQAYRASMGVLNLTKTFPNSVVNQACRHGWNREWISCKSIKDEAEKIQLAREAAEESSQMSLIPENHENIRGAGYYQ